MAQFTMGRLNERKSSNHFCHFTAKRKKESAFFPHRSFLSKVRLLKKKEEKKFPFKTKD
jgi:hypothetical protein